MLRAIIIALLAAASAKNTNPVTFKNVVVGGFSMFSHKFNITIPASNSLKEHLPKQAFDKIEIVNNSIPTLYKNSINVEDLDELILDGNDLKEIQPGAFSNVPQLRKLVIINNPALETIKNHVFNNLNVATLDLSNNAINSISSGAFDNMPELLSINLADNQIKLWNKNWFANTPLLSRVSMQNNQIEKIPTEAFANLQGEKKYGTVDLTINIILSHNKISKIDTSAFRGLKTINNLWLDGNELHSWDEDLLSGVALKELRINDNKIKCLSGDLGKIFVASKTYIDGNPWQCSCLMGIEEWISKHGKDVSRFYSKLNCDAERIEQKIKDLNNRLEELRETDVTESS